MPADYYRSAHDLDHTPPRDWPSNGRVVAAACVCGLRQVRTMRDGRTVAIETVGAELTTCSHTGRQSTPYRER